MVPMDELPSSMQAIKRGWLLPGREDLFGQGMGLDSWDTRAKKAPKLVEL